MIVKSGEYPVLHSGTVLTFKDEPISFEVADNMLVRLLFKTDPLKGEGVINYLLVDKTQLDLELINFDHSQGASPVEPLELGHLNGRKLYFNFSVYSAVTTTDGIKRVNTRTLHYTWYTRELMQSPTI